MRINLFIFSTVPFLVFINDVFSQNQIFDDGFRIVNKASIIDTIRPNSVIQIRNSVLYIDSVATKYDQILSDNNGNYLGHVNYRCVVLDDRGNVIIPEGYTQIIREKNFFKVCKNNKWGIINTEGREIAPCIYSIIHNDGDHFRVRQKEKWGVIDSLGNLIIPVVYDMLQFVNQNMIKALKGNYVGLVDRDNDIIMDFKYAYIDFITEREVKCCECEELIQAKSSDEIKKYTDKGYTHIDHSTRLMLLCKNPKYLQMKIDY